MTKQEKQFIEILAKVEARAQIAEAKATLAIEMIARMNSSPPKIKGNDPNYPFNATFEKMQSEKDLAASIAFKSIVQFTSSIEEKTVHDAMSKIETQKMELEEKIHSEFITLFSHS